MFGSIARRYDIANHLLSCGMDFYWRRYAAKVVADWRPHSIADLATGTGDLALALQKKLPEAEITGVDFLPEMLELAPDNPTVFQDRVLLCGAIVVFSQEAPSDQRRSGNVEIPPHSVRR